MCNIWRTPPSLRKEELSLIELQKLFDQNYWFRVENVLITGGEPFLRQDLVEIILYLKKTFPVAGIGLTSTGISTERIINVVKDLDTSTNFIRKPLGIGISIDGYGENHDAIRGIKGGFQKAVNTIKALKEFRGISCLISFTIMPTNWHDLLGIYELACDLNTGFVFRFAQISSAFYNNCEMQFKWQLHDLTKIKEFTSKILTKKESGFLTRIRDPFRYFVANMVKYQIEHKRLFNCYSGTHSFFLDPYGNVRPCVMLDQVFGNIKDRIFEQIWNSNYATKIRTMIKNKKCHCWTECEACLSLPRNLKVMIESIWRELRLYGCISPSFENAVTKGCPQSLFRKDKSCLSRTSKTL